MPDLQDGERVEVQGSTSVYTLSRAGDVRACTCPAWRNQTITPAQRTCKHLRGYIGEAVEQSRVGSGGTPLPQRPAVREGSADRERRRAVLADVVESFPVVYDKMLLVYNLRMPRHLAYAIGWWQALTDEERGEAWAYIGNGPCGVSDWFYSNLLKRQVIDGLDERLQYRYRRDPPEFVTIFGGNSDGSHWGLWYDDPAELPRMIAHNWARDTGETGTCKPTLLATLAEEMGKDRDGDWKHRAKIKNWLDEVLVDELIAYRAERIPPYPERPYILGGPGPWIAGVEMPADLVSRDHRTFEKYRDNAPEVATWIAQAREELTTNPIRALAIGREMFWHDHDTLREEAIDLLEAAYRAVGRGTLADIARLHHTHRDLKSVHVYAPEPTHPFVEAWGKGDRDAVAAMLAQSPLPEPALRYFVHTTDPAMIDVFLAVPEIRATIDDAQAHHATQIDYWKDRDDNDYSDMRARHRTALEYLVGKSPLGLAAFTAVAGTGNSELVSWAVATVDITRPGVLHVACRACNVDMVRALLERGADARVRDADGQLAYDAVRHGWEKHRAEAAQIYDLLRARGGAPAPAGQRVPAGTWTAGTKVTHAKFGEGTVKSAAGTGDDAKLTIEFASGTKTLLGKFVKR